MIERKTKKKKMKINLSFYFITTGILLLVILFMSFQIYFKDSLINKQNYQIKNLQLKVNSLTNIRFILPFQKTSNNLTKIVNLPNLK